MYDLSGATPTVPVLTFNNPQPETHDLFGGSVAISGTGVVIGVYQDDFGGEDAGAAYIYNVAGPTPALPVATIHKPTPTPYDYFGDAVAIDGNTIVVGASRDDGNTAVRGAVYVFGPPNPGADSDGLLDTWEVAHWGTTIGHSALDDFDEDGVRELIEQAFLLNPKVPDAEDAPQPVTEDGYLTITINKQPGVSYTVLSAGSADSDAFSAVSTTVLVDSASTLKVRDNEPITSSGARFMKVKVTAAP
jgi:hypothetical protein